MRSPRLVAIAGLLVAAGAAVAVWQSDALEPAHALARSGRFQAEPAALWETVLDLGAQGAWRTGLAAVERQPDVRGHEVWREVESDGSATTWETVEVLPERRLVRCVVDQDGPYGGCVTVELIRRQPGAILSISEKLTVHSEWFRRTQSVAGRRERLDAWLADLGARFGETPRIADLPKDLRDPPAAPTADPVAAEGAPAPAPVAAEGAPAP